MSFIRRMYIKAKNGIEYGPYYVLVESVRVGKRVTQRIIAYVGSWPGKPSTEPRRPIRHRHARRGHRYIGKERRRVMKNRFAGNKAAIKKHKDLSTCERCGKRLDTRNRVLHHRRRVSEGGANEPKNIRVLCSDCHNEIHARERHRQRKV